MGMELAHLRLASPSRRKAGRRRGRQAQMHAPPCCKMPGRQAAQSRQAKVQQEGWKKRHRRRGLWKKELPHPAGLPLWSSGHAMPCPAGPATGERPRPAPPHPAGLPRTLVTRMVPSAPRDLWNSSISRSG